MENPEIRTSYARADSLLSSCPYSRPLHFRFSHADHISPRPNWRTVFRNRQVGLRIAQLGMAQARAMYFRGKLIISAVSLTLPSTRRSLALRRDVSMEPDAFVFLLSLFLFPSHPPFTSFFFSNYPVIILTEYSLIYNVHLHIYILYICIYLYIIADTNITCDHLLRSLHELATPCTKRRVFGINQRVSTAGRLLR